MAATFESKNQTLGGASLTTPTLTTPKVVTSIKDTNGNELIEVGATTSAVNQIKVSNAATSGVPLIEATGDDAAVPIQIRGKGTGAVYLGQSTCQGIALFASSPLLDENNNELFKFTATGSAVNEITLANAATGNNPTLTASGDDAAIGINLVAKGAGIHKITGPVQLGATTTAALNFGGGTSTTPLSTAVADKNFIGFWTKSTATSGDSRGAYLRHYLAGAGVMGECLRAYTTVDGVAATGGQGAHISLSFANSGSITGLGTGVRGTFHVPNAAMAAGGTFAAAQAEIYCDGNSSDISPTSEHSLLRLVVDGGNATSQNLVKNAIAVRLTSGADATGNMVYTHTHTPGDAAGSLRILVNGTARYLKFWAAE